MNSFPGIKWVRVSIATCVLAIGAAAAAGCAKDSSGGGGSSGSGGFGLGGAGGLVGGTGGSGGAGNGTGGRGSGGSGSGGSGGAGSGGSGAVAGTGGMSGTGAAAGSGGSAGGTTGALHGGSSAKFICQPGATYGNPLPTSIVVTQIGPPTTPPANYFAFIEGPIWIGSLQTLFFSDNASQPQERIFSLVPPSTTPRDFMELSGSNGMAVDNNDKLIVGDQRNMRITRVDPVTAQTLDIIVPAGAFKPNDVIVRSDNNIYFTDSLSGVAIGFYRVSPTGVVTGPMKQLALANGIALSPDENTLFVGDQGSSQIHRFTLSADGTVNTASDQLFATAMGQTLDGMCMDCAGNLYAGTGSGVEVYAATGAYVGTVPTGESSNCTFGGADRKTIYVTSRMVLKVATLNVPGLPD